MPDFLKKYAKKAHQMTTIDENGKEEKVRRGVGLAAQKQKALKAGRDAGQKVNYIGSSPSPSVLILVMA